MARVCLEESRSTTVRSETPVVHVHAAVRRSRRTVTVNRAWSIPVRPPRIVRTVRLSRCLTARNTIVVENFDIPPMTTVCVLPFIQHRDEEMFPDPEEFVPERFLDEEIKSKLHAFGYIPFSAGARNCIGLYTG